MKTCAYKGCRHEIKPGSPYCKYHARLIEIENNSPQWLNDMIREMREKMNGTESVSETTAPGEHPVKIKGG